MQVFEIISIAAVHGFEATTETLPETDTEIRTFYRCVFRANVKGSGPELVATFIVTGMPETASKLPLIVLTSNL